MVVAIIGAVVIGTITYVGSEVIKNRETSPQQLEELGSTNGTWHIGWVYIGVK